MKFSLYKIQGAHEKNNNNKFDQNMLENILV